MSKTSKVTRIDYLEGADAANVTGGNFWGPMVLVENNLKAAYPDAEIFCDMHNISNAHRLEIYLDDDPTPVSEPQYRGGTQWTQVRDIINYSWEEFMLQLTPGEGDAK